MKKEASKGKLVKKTKNPKKKPISLEKTKSSTKSLKITKQVKAIPKKKPVVLKKVKPSEKKVKITKPVKKIPKKKSVKENAKKTVKSAKKTVINPLKKTQRKPVKKQVKKVEKKVTVKAEKKSENAKKTTNKKNIPSSSRIFVNKKTPVVLQNTPEKPKTKQDTKPIPAQTQNLGLPEGSVYQPTGQRRPLIVFPK